MRKVFVVLVLGVGLVIGVLVAPSLGADEKSSAETGRAVPIPRAVSSSIDTVFVPINPVRAFDSRQAAYPASGLLGPNQTKVIPVKDGHNNVGVVTQVDVVPPGASGVAYNATITQATGPNWVSVTPGDAGFFTTSAINFNINSGDLANAGIVSLDANRQIKLWGGQNPGSTHVVIDITGYFIERDMWAKVDADSTGATLLHGHGATSVSRVGTGVFSVTFDRAVTGCGWLATRNDNLDGVAAPGEIAIELGSSSDPSTLWVRTFGSSGAQADPASSDGFTVFVDC